MPQDSSPATDSVIAEIKGPDPEVWGEQHANTDPGEVGEGSIAGLSIGYVSEDGQLKGPGSEWETNDEGEYVNRG